LSDTAVYYAIFNVSDQTQTIPKSITDLLPLKNGTELWQQKEQTIANAEVPTHGVRLFKGSI
jgi:hypothetical protein